jgi:glucokinase
VADIGGTNFRLAISDIDRMTIENFALLSTGDFSRPQEAIERYLKTIPHRPDLVGIAVAGPIDGDVARMTNRPWTFTKAEIQAATGARYVAFVNDFEALALAVTTLTDYDLQVVRNGRPALDGNRIVLGPGTGLGLAGLVWQQERSIPVASEGGHASFGALTSEELALLAKMDLAPGTVTAEKLLSGAGLASLYNAMASGKAGAGTRDWFDTPRIIKAALSGQDALAARALDQFVAWLGRFASDMALAFGARGGIYLGGGIAPNIVSALKGSTFRSAFIENSEMARYLDDIPIWVIKDGADAELKGAAIALARSLPAEPAALRQLQVPDDEVQ